MDIARLQQLMKVTPMDVETLRDEVDAQEEEIHELVELETQNLLVGLREPDNVGLWDSEADLGEEEDGEIVTNEDFDALANLAKKDKEWGALNANIEPALGSETKRHGAVHPLSNGGFSYVKSQVLTRAGVDIKNIIVNKGVKGSFENRIGVSEAMHVLEAILHHRQQLGVPARDYLMMHLRPAVMKFYHAFQVNYTEAVKLQRQAITEQNKKKTANV